MKRVCCIAVMIVMAMFSPAQTQQGYVKTLGRPNQKGVALSGVSVRLKGGHNAVVSNAQGSFGMPMPGKKPGDAYTLQQVQKQGYELKDKAAVGRQYAYSDKVPLTLVMASSSQLSTDKQRIENKAYEVAEKNYKAKLAQLEQQKITNAITIEQYRQQLQDLQDKFEKYQSLIDGLAEHYALVDYDALDEQEREINLCIENGDLERADSLLQRLGIHQRAEDIAQRLKAGQQLMEEAQQEQAEVLKRQEKDAEYLYQLYTIALAKFDNDKARFYIETRAELDPENWEWNSEAGEFNQKQNNYQKAELYYLRIIKVAKHMAEADPFNAILYAITLNNLGAICHDTQKYQESEQYYQQALKVRQQLKASLPDEIKQEMDEEIAQSLHNLAMMYLDQKRFDESGKYFEESVPIFRRLASGQSVDALHKLSVSLGGLAIYYRENRKYQESEKCYKEALDIQRELVKHNNEEYTLNFAETLNNLGLLYFTTKNYTESEKYYTEALGIYRSLTDRNPDAYRYELAQNLNNLGALYYEMQQYDKSLKQWEESLFYYQAQQTEYIEINDNKVPEILNNLGIVYRKQNNIAASIDSFEKCLALYRQLMAKAPSQYTIDVVQTLNNLGNSYRHEKNYLKCETLYQEALKLSKDLVLKNVSDANEELSHTLYNLADLYFRTEKYTESERYYSELFPVTKLLAQEKPGIYRLQLANYYLTYGCLKFRTKNYAATIDNLETAISIFNSIRDLPENGKEFLIDALYIVGQTYYIQNNYLKAYESYDKLLPLIKVAYQANPTTWKDKYVTTQGNLSYFCIFNKKYIFAEQYARMAIQTDASEMWLYPALAESILFQGKYAQAREIYLKYKSQLKDDFIEDLESYEKKGVIPPQHKMEVEQIKNLLRY